MANKQENLFRELNMLYKTARELSVVLEGDDWNLVIGRLKEREKLLESFKKNNLESIKTLKENAQNADTKMTGNLQKIIDGILTLDKKNSQILKSRIDKTIKSISDLSKEQKAIKDLRNISKKDKKHIIDFLY
jgi:hypothetical protein